MIIFTLLTRSNPEAHQVCELLLTQKMAIQVFIDEAIDEYHLQEEKLIQDKLFRVICLTKAMLFDDIERLISTHFPENEFRYYSTPVTQIDARIADQIRKTLPN